MGFLRVIVIVSIASCALACVYSPVTSDCLACICQVESNCRLIGCNPDGRTDSCGPFQIKSVYYQDAYARSRLYLGSNWRSCTTGIDAYCCSVKVVQAYMSRYATRSRLGYTPTCQDFARIHNGGPNGYRYSSTVSYWNRVQSCLRNRG